jgi:hypothetical protein
MSETMIGLIPAIGSLVMVVGCIFYMLGGRSNKWLRRFIGSLICATAVWLTAYILGVFQWVMLWTYPLTILRFSLGYCPDNPTWQRVLKRSIIAVSVAANGLIFCFALGGTAWLILPLQVFIALGSVWLGVKNPMPAAAEEFFVCLLLEEGDLMYPFTAIL